jgi:DNA-binding PadR family transcriptional regulator
MVPIPARGGERARGALTLYALALMEREGSIHGYRLAERIEERTEGAWRPGPGAVYPALQRLVSRGLARRTRHGRRQDYTITKAGRELLSRIRARAAPARRGDPDLPALWAEVMGERDPGAFLLVRLRTSIDRLSLHLDRSATAAPAAQHLRSDALAELERGVARLRRRRPSARGLPPRGRT